MSETPEYYGTLEDFKKNFKNGNITLKDFKERLISYCSYPYSTDIDIKSFLEGVEFIASLDDEYFLSKKSFDFNEIKPTKEEKEKIKNILKKGEELSLKDFLFILQALFIEIKLNLKDSNLLIV